MCATKAAVIALSALSLVFIIAQLRYQLITNDKLRPQTNRSVSPALLHEMTGSKTEAPAIVRDVITRHRRARRLFEAPVTSPNRRHKPTLTSQMETSGYFQFHYVINSVKICSSRRPLDRPVFLLNYVHSAVGNLARRTRVRASWARRSNYPDERVETVFFVGLPSGDTRLTTQAAVMAESRQFGDIVQVNVIDSYRNMTVKALAALDWISRYCINATYFLKADDDAFVNVFAAIKHLRDIESVGLRRQLLMCLVWRRPVVSRRGKWAVSRTEFARRRYPTYCCGLGYVITADVLVLLLSAAAACQHVCGNSLSGDHVTAAGNLSLYDDVTNGDVVTDTVVTASDDSVTDVVSNHDTDVSYDVTTNVPVAAGRRFWIDDVYITGLLVESLGGRVKHTDMSAAYCKSDKMAAIYRHVTEWYKYVFTQVADDEAHLYRDTWNALRQRAANTTIPSPSVTRPAHLADHYIPLSTMLEMAKRMPTT